MTPVDADADDHNDDHADMKTTDWCDARADIQVCCLPLVGFGRRRAFSGRVRTARSTGGIGAIRELVNQPGAGQVLVIDGALVPWRALFGDVMAARAIDNGWAGVVVNGLIRDRREIDAMDIGVKALGTVPQRASLDGASEVDVTVRFGEATFVPQAYLVADEDGVILLPPGLAGSGRGAVG